MSYDKMMKRQKSHRHDNDLQPIILSIPTDKDTESGVTLAERTANTFNVRVRDSINDDFVKVSDEFLTEDDAVQYIIDNNLEDKHKWVRIYTDAGLHLSGW